MDKDLGKYLREIIELLKKIEDRLDQINSKTYYMQSK